MVGQENLRRALLVSLATEGHVLLESVPGLAKTLAASTLAQAVGAHFARIQCTPDLLPSDMVGTQVYDPRTHEFDTQLGPVHANIVLLDEINRSSAKTQSRHARGDAGAADLDRRGVHPLPQPFLVLATQNPIDEEGTYVLPRPRWTGSCSRRSSTTPDRRGAAVLDRIDDGTLGRDRRR